MTQPHQDGSGTPVDAPVEYGSLTVVFTRGGRTTRWEATRVREFHVDTDDDEDLPDVVGLVEAARKSAVEGPPRYRRVRMDAECLPDERGVFSRVRVEGDR